MKTTRTYIITETITREVLVTFDHEKPLTTREARKMDNKIAGFIEAAPAKRAALSPDLPFTIKRGATPEHVAVEADWVTNKDVVTE